MPRHLPIRTSPAPSVITARVISNISCDDAIGDGGHHAVTDDLAAGSIAAGPKPVALLLGVTALRCLLGNRLLGAGPAPVAEDAAGHHQTEHACTDES
jgi:hypothetical protein